MAAPASGVCVKSALAGDMRRFTLAPPYALATLRALLRKVYGLPEYADVTVKYRDDEGMWSSPKHSSVQPQRSLSCFFLLTLAFFFLCR